MIHTIAAIQKSDSIGPKPTDLLKRTVGREDDGLYDPYGYSYRNEDDEQANRRVIKIWTSMNKSAPYNAPYNEVGSCVSNSGDRHMVTVLTMNVHCALR